MYPTSFYDVKYITLNNTNNVHVPIIWTQVIGAALKINKLKPIALITCKIWLSHAISSKLINLISCLKLTKSFELRRVEKQFYDCAKRYDINKILMGLTIKP